MNKNYLFIVAHPDDEILGCGGSLSKLVLEGNCVNVLILSKGVSSRYKNKTKKILEEEINRVNAAKRVKKLLGYSKLIINNFPDNQFDSVNLLEIVKKIEEVIDNIKPSVVITHSETDLNIDHKITSLATRTACRPNANDMIEEIWEFETPSSTEWSFTNNFKPNLWIDIKKSFATKLLALKEYSMEMRNYPHPRSLDSLTISNKYFGQQVNLEICERFRIIRKLVY